MGKVADDEALIVCGVAHQTNAVTASATRVEDRLVIDADEDLVADGLVKPLRLSLRLGHIVDVAVSRV